jgi:serine/threonine protein kinase
MHLAFDDKGDIWAFGCIIYELISVQRLFLTDAITSMTFGKHKFDAVIFSESRLAMEVALDQFVNSTKLSSESRSRISETLLRTLNPMPEARPTATAIKGVLHEVISDLLY